MFLRMTRKLHALTMNRQKLLLLGASLALVGILLAASFQFVENHRWYWTVAPLVSLLVLFSAAFGGLLVGHGLSRGQNRRLWLAALGGILGIGWLGTGTVAAGLAALGMYYLPVGESYIGWGSYSSGYWLRSFDISFLQLATVTGLLSGFSIGLGLAAKRLWPLTSVPAFIRGAPIR